MGNREALMKGALDCLRHKGFAGTTARDVAQAANVSLAAIGYHFGTVRELMDVALIEATRQWADAVEGQLAADGERLARLEPLDRFEKVWARIIELFPAHRAVWAAQLEAAAQPDRSKELAEFLARSQEEGRLGLAELFHGKAFADRRTALAVGAAHQALLTGVMAQLLVDPTRAPSARELALAVRAMCEDLGGRPARRRAVRAQRRPARSG